MAEVLTEGLSNRGLVFSSSLLLFYFWMQVYFPPFYGDLAVNSVAGREG